MDAFFQNKKDFEFNKKLTAETSLLEEWFTNDYFTEQDLQIGAEIELFLLDADLNPAPKNLSFISEVKQEFLVPEVGASHLEINTPHFKLTKNCFSLLHQNILRSLNYCTPYAVKNNYFLALIGSLPTATNEHHQLLHLTKKKRYTVLNSLIRKYNNGCPININVEGFEPIQLKAESLAVNGLLSAFQMHLQIGLSQSVRYYNIAQLIAGPMMALSTNSPFFLNHFLWHESRVFIFKEAMTLNSFHQNKFHCCLFGDDYLQSSFFELFKNNLYFPYLIPEIRDSPKDKMIHVRQQNGVIYRWNRPVIDFNQEGVPHLRIEHRGPSSGPTVVDMIANAAFYYGLMQYYYESSELIETLLPFPMAKKNFFNAAKYGLNTNFYWGTNRKKLKATEVLKNLIPNVKKGLVFLNIDKEDINFYLNIITKRVTKNSSGSNWQLEFVKKYGKDFSGLLAVYLENQYKDITISEWTL